MAQCTGVIVQGNYAQSAPILNPVKKILDIKIILKLRIVLSLARVYRVTGMDARGKFGEHERSVRVARGDSREQL